MKNKYIQIPLLILVILAGMLYSCYDDKSSYADHRTVEVIIDTTGSSKVIEHQFGSAFSMSKEVTQPGVENPALSYEWKISMSNSTDTSTFYVLSKEKEFSVVLANTPASDPYNLIFTVTDENTGIQYFATWKVLVVSGLGEGLVVADTKDGLTSDLTHIQANGVTEGYTGADVITRNLYSVANGEFIDGKVTSLCFSSAIVNLPTGGRGYENRLYVNTNKTMLTVDPSSYAISHLGNDLFWVSQSSYVTSFMHHGPQSAFYCGIGGKMFLITRNSAIGGKFGSAENFLDESMIFGKYMVSETTSSEVYLGYSAYDERNGQFCVREASLAMFPLRVMTEGGAFDGANVKGFEYKGAGQGNNREHLHLLQEKATGEYYIFRIARDDNKNIIAKSKLNVTSCPNINSAVNYVFCNNQEVMYYATSSKIYAAVLGTSGASVSEQNVVDLETNEQITGIKMYRQAWYDMQWNDPTKTPIPENNMQLILTTYNTLSKEGKVYLLPIAALNSGKLGTPTKVFDGFNEIVAVGTQAR